MMWPFPAAAVSKSRVIASFPEKNGRSSPSVGGGAGRCLFVTVKRNVQASIAHELPWADTKHQSY